MQPEQFGPYTLLERLGIGGMAEVYLAHTRDDDGAQRKVAVKRLLFQHSQDRSFVSMFADEARISARLVHPNIAQVFDFGEVDERSFIAMEYVEGKELPDLIGRYEDVGMPAPMVLYIGRGVAEALSHAHEMLGDDGECLNIVHRDISPQNVLVAYSGEVKLIDFGIAKAKIRLEETVGGVVKGKFAYMSPEQVEGGQIDGRSDVFSLGIVLWEMLAGKPLFMSDNALMTASKVLTAKIPPLAAHNPGVSAELDAVVQRALARKQEERFQSAGELARVLTHLAEDGRLFTERDMARWMRETFRDIAQLDSPLLGFGDEEDETRADLPSSSLARLAASAPDGETSEVQRPAHEPVSLESLAQAPVFDAQRDPFAGARERARDGSGLWAERTTDVQAPSASRGGAPSPDAPTIAPGQLMAPPPGGSAGGGALSNNSFVDEDEDETRADLRSYAPRAAQVAADFEQRLTPPRGDALALADTPIDDSLERRLAEPPRGQPREQPLAARRASPDARPGAGLDALPTRLHSGPPREQRLVDADTDPLRAPASSKPALSLGQPTRPARTDTTGPQRLDTPRSGHQPARHAGRAAPSARRAEAPPSSPLWYWVLLGGIVVVGAVAAALLLVL